MIRVLLVCPCFLAAALTAIVPRAARAQPINLAHGGPITITASDGLEWRQADQIVVARGAAQAVRGTITLNADQLSARYRKKAGATVTAAAPAPSAPATPPVADPGLGDGSSEIYRLEADGNVRIDTPTDHAEGDRAVYDIDQAVLVMTGHKMRITTPDQLITARDSIEYWSDRHMAVARGNAAVQTKDGKRLAADTLIAYTTQAASPPSAPHPTPSPAAASPPATPPTAKPQSASPSANVDPLSQSGQLKQVDAIGNVVIRTATDTVIGERAVYVPETGVARIAGHVRITRGENQLDGNEAEVDLKTGVSRLLASPGGRVEGIVLPRDAAASAATPDPGALRATPNAH